MNKIRDMLHEVVGVCILVLFQSLTNFFLSDALYYIKVAPRQDHFA